MPERVAREAGLPVPKAAGRDVGMQQDRKASRSGFLSKNSHTWCRNITEPAGNEAPTFICRRGDSLSRKVSICFELFDAISLLGKN